MITEQITVVPQCAQCGHVWVPTEGECWRCNFDTDSEPVFYCPDCAEREVDEGHS
jgi:uncharacterized OB-fold protein